jgi:hypothetical protein
MYLYKKKMSKNIAIATTIFALAGCHSPNSNNPSVQQQQTPTTKAAASNSITRTVTTTSDENDGSNAGEGLSLREAVISANQSSDSNVIELKGGETYNLSLSDTNTTNFETDNPDASVGDLDIVGGANITIRGIGNSQATIDASNLGSVSGERRDRVFEVLANGNLRLENVQVTGGKAPLHENPNIFLEGGGIRVNDRAQLTLTNSTVSGNSAAVFGGGISIVDNGSATITNSTISGNSADEGGGILNYGSATVTNSTISGNSSSDDSGGIYNKKSITVTNSTISSNSASDRGGGLLNLESASLTNSTISDNSAEIGGGIDNSGFASISLTNSTISRNFADKGGGLFNSGSATVSNSTISGNSADEGGGLFNKSYNSATITNAIIANSSGSNDVFNQGTINTSGNNIVEDSSFTDANVINQNPQLGPLSDNGSATQTHKPLNGSPVIDAGVNDVVPADSQDLDEDGNTSENIPYDQRGDGYNRVANGTVDIGAVEVQQ